MGVVLLLWIGLEAAPYLEQNPISYTNQPFPVDGPIRPGGVIPMHVIRCSSLQDTTDIEFARSLIRVDGETRAYSLGDGRSVVLPGCMESLTGTSVVPENVVPGYYQVVGVVTVNGAARTHKVSYRSATFEVIR